MNSGQRGWDWAVSGLYVLDRVGRAIRICLFPLVQAAITALGSSGSRLLAALNAVGQYTGVVVDRPTLDGRLATACPDAGRTRAAPPGRPAPSPAARLSLGRPLGLDRRDQGDG